MREGGIWDHLGGGMTVLFRDYLPVLTGLLYAWTASQLPFVVLWLALMPVHAPASQTHSAVTRLSLVLSGHKMAYTRSDMLRKLHRRHDEAGDTKATWAHRQAVDGAAIAGELARKEPAPRGTGAY